MRHLTAKAAANIPFGSPSQADLLVYLPTPERRSPELSAFLSQASFGWGSLLDVNRETTVTNDGYLSEHALKGVWYAWREASGRLHRVYRDLKRDPDCLNTRLAPSLAGMITTPPEGGTPVRVHELVVVAYDRRAGKHALFYDGRLIGE